MNRPDYIHFTNDPGKALNEVLRELNPDQVAYLVDENTKQHCLPKLELPEDAQIIEIHSGEIFKNLNTCELIWTQLTAWGFSRKSLLVNLGGGVIGDMGGFAASTYKRGVRFINIPTTLLAAVDANIGGKLGIDFKGFKNHIGVFNDPDAVIIWDGFLKTLPDRELRSGFAEVIKHGLIYDKDYWEDISSKNFPDLDWLEVIKRSVDIKSDVVAEDPKENGLRKILNFGHTIGHGIETWYLNSGKDLLHGEAISVGMITEAYLAHYHNNLSEKEMEKISSYVIGVYNKFELPEIVEILPIMMQDKKNINSEISFSLLKEIGTCLFDQKVDLKLVGEAFDYYNQLNK